MIEVTSLELAKKSLEIGIKMETDHNYYQTYWDKDWKIDYMDCVGFALMTATIPAPTASEWIKVLADECKYWKGVTNPQTVSKLVKFVDSLIKGGDESSVDALALMAIWLKENGLF